MEHERYVPYAVQTTAGLKENFEYYVYKKLHEHGVMDCSDTLRIYEDDKRLYRTPKQYAAFEHIRWIIRKRFESNFDCNLKNYSNLSKQDYDILKSYVDDIFRNW